MKAKRKQLGKRSRERMAKPVEQAFCAHCRVWMPVDHVCPSGNKANAARGNMPVVSVRMDVKTRERLQALADKRSAVQRWPRVTSSTLVLEAVRELLAKEGM